MSQNRHPAGTSVGGEFAPGAASEVDEELEDDGQQDRQGVEDVLRGYSDFCFKHGDQPDAEVLKRIQSAQTRDEAEEIVDQLDLEDAINDRPAPGADIKDRARSIRSSYVTRRLMRNLKPSRRHVQVINDFIDRPGDSSERMFKSLIAGLRASAR